MNSAVKWALGLAAVGGLVFWLMKTQSGQAALKKGESVVSQLTQAGLDMIAQFEGFAPTPYNDPPGSTKYSIGFGHQIQPGENLTRVTLDEAKALLAKDTAHAQDVVRSVITRPLTDAQFNALTSLVYNIGESAFRAGTIPTKVNAGDFARVAQTMQAYNKSGGQVNASLVKRRAVEASAFA
jgi:lysozyme